MGLLIAATACGRDRPAGASAPPVALAALGPAPGFGDFEPKKGKGAWARADWRRPHAFCRTHEEKPAPTGVAPQREHWMETCTASEEPKLVVTIHGSGFAVPARRNSVFFGGVAADVVSGDAASRSGSG